MYEYLKKLLELAEGIGNIEDVDMGGWINNGKKLEVAGTASDGRHFELRLTMDKEADNA